MKQLVKASDGSQWLIGRGGPKLVKAAPANVPPKPVELPPAPEKKKHKTYKLHYTKPWQGTYGRFLQIFGNRLPHAPNYDLPEQNYPDASLGNMFLVYNPDSKNIWVLTHRTEHAVYVALRLWSGQITQNSGLTIKSDANPRRAYKVLMQAIEAKLSNPSLGIPLDEICPELGPPIPADTPELEPIPVIEMKRECPDPNCAWCHTPKKVATTNLANCQICGAGYHKWNACAYKAMFGGEILYEKDDWHVEFCIACGSLDHPTAECDWQEPETCAGCGLPGHDFQECPNHPGIHRGRMGATILVAPWEKRGVVVHTSRTRFAGDAWEKIWQIDNMKWDPLQANADLITLDFVAQNLRAQSVKDDALLNLIIDEAKQRLKAHVAYIDPRLRAYVDMVVGGELRHHRAVGGEILPGHERTAAWAGWKKIREVVGADALLDAKALFEDIQRNSYGGVKWGAAAKLLWMREVNKISPFIFCDKVFDMQHNGGSLLNKVRWKNRDDGASIAHIKTWLGPARAQTVPDWTVILYFGGDTERALFNEYWERSSRYVLGLTGTPSGLVPRPRNEIQLDWEWTPPPPRMRQLWAHYPNFVRDDRIGSRYTKPCLIHGVRHETAAWHACADPHCWTRSHKWGQVTRSLVFCPTFASKCQRCGERLLCPEHEFLVCSFCAPYVALEDRLPNPHFWKNIDMEKEAHKYESSLI